MANARPLCRDTTWYQALVSIVTAYAVDHVTTAADAATTALITASVTARQSRRPRAA
jgi:hypothetical protein